MKISTTKEGVTFSGMSPLLAEAIIDLAKDLNSGDCVILYGPGYEPIVRPTDDLREQFDRLLHAEVKMLGGISNDPDAKRFDAQPVLEETHIRVWNEIFPQTTPEEK